MTAELTRIELDRLPSLAAAYGRAVLARKKGLASGATIPAIEARLREARIDPVKLGRYNALCGFAAADSVPVSYPQVLALALQARLILAPAFPLPPLGLIHRASSITSHRVLAVGEPFALRCWVARARHSERGVEIEIATQALAEGVVVWESVTTALCRRGARVARERREAPPRPPEERNLLHAAVWDLPAGLGRSYARVSGDYNPIHLSRLTAVLFGYPRPIAHGLWSLARSLAELGSHVAPPPVRVEVQFKRPIFLPTSVRFAARHEGTDIAFSLRSLDRTTLHLLGRVARL